MSMTATKARANLFNLIDKVSESHKPIVINGRRNSAVLISEEDWSSIQETMYIMSVPGLYESIVEGINTPISECSLEWQCGN